MSAETEAVDVTTAAAQIGGLLGDDLGDETTEAGSEDASQGGEEEAQPPEFEEDESYEAEEEDDPDDYDAESEVDEDAEDEAEPDEEPDDPAPQTYKVKVDGEEVEVSLDELQAGYSREADYRRKTMRLADERRALESEAEGVRAKREEYGQRLEALGRALEQYGPKKPDATLRQADPAEYAAQLADWQEHQNQLQAVQAEQQRAQLEAQQETLAQRQALLAQERERLYEAIPEWRDEEVARTEASKLKAYANDLGYPDEVIDRMEDHRAFVMLRKAMLYDELTTKGKAAIKEKAKKPSKTLEPGSPKAKKKKDPSATARRRLAQTGRVDDAAAAIEQLFGDDI